MHKTLSILLPLALAACASQAPTAFPHDGQVFYGGAQKTIFETGKAEGVVPIERMSGAQGAYGLGAYEGLDGEITVFEGKPYVTQVRGKDLVLASPDHGKAIFGAWTQQTQWRDVPIPASVKSYLDVQRFVKAQAQANGIDVTQAFPFLMRGQADEVRWHVNVDLSDGQPITPEVFAKSKASYVLRQAQIDIVGFYADKQGGVFISSYAPGIREKGVANALHLHLLSQDRQAAGHIDDLTLSGAMVLRLPVGATQR